MIHEVLMCIIQGDKTVHEAKKARNAGRTV